MQTYLELARQGKNGLWRTVLAVLLILFMWQIIGALPIAAVLVWTILNGKQHGVVATGNLSGLGMLPNLVLTLLPAVFFIGGIYLAMRFIHRRPMRTLVTPARSVAWGRLFQGFGAWFVLVALMSLVEALLHPGRYAWTPDMQHFLPFAFLALVLVPIQTSAEELLFRGYILQQVGLRSRNIWLLCAVSGLLFGLPHLLNPEASVSYPLLGFYYISMGFFLAYITLRDGSLELALGVHAANDLFSALIANYAITTVLPSPSLFTINVLDAVYTLPAALVGMALFLWLFLGPFRRKGDITTPVRS
ncbi:MAG: CPBP family intramembrane glutamic endopeptidase [Anaerolineales bacterium]